MKKTALFVLLFLYKLFVIGQCTFGIINYSGSGCGCGPGCDLSSIGGPNCGPVGTSGVGCPSLAMSQLINVPIGQKIRVCATMEPRPSCPFSGMDSGDNLKVDMQGGPKPYVTGSNNSSVVDSYEMTGPGTIEVSGTANRSDEVITYIVAATPSGCPSCILPVDFAKFTATAHPTSIQLHWETANEINTDYYLIERAKVLEARTENLGFEAIGRMKALGNTGGINAYTNFDTDAIIGRAAYRIKQIDGDGGFEYSKIVTVDFEEQFLIRSISPNPSSDYVSIMIAGNGKTALQLSLTDAFGKVIWEQSIATADEFKIDMRRFAAGIYILQAKGKDYFFTQKLMKI